MAESASEPAAPDCPTMKCVLCQAPLPLELVGGADGAQSWTCVRCGTSYEAVLREDVPAEFLQNVRLTASPEGEPPPTPSGEPVEDSPAGAEARELPTSDGAFPIRPPIQCPLHTPVSRELDSAIEEGRSLRIRPQGKPFARGMRQHKAVPPPSAVKEKFVADTDRRADQLSETFEHLVTGNPARLDTLGPISERALAQAVEDIDLFATLGIHPPAGDYPSRHALHVGMLSMAIGAAMAWDRDSLLELSVGCLMHDLGMLCVDRSSYAHERDLSVDEYREIAKHPVKIFDLISPRLDHVSAVSRMVAYQIHERCNGSGYPRGRSGGEIHEAAMIAAVADVFVALMSPRPHRPSLIPYRAIERILHDTKVGLYDPGVVRALLRTVSLFPLGSYVELSDGRRGQVIRAGGDQYTRPVVEIQGNGGGPRTSSVVDLREEKDLRVVRGLPLLDA